MRSKKRLKGGHPLRSKNKSKKLKKAGQGHMLLVRYKKVNMEAKGCDTSSLSEEKSEKIQKHI